MLHKTFFGRENICERRQPLHSTIFTSFLAFFSLSFSFLLPLTLFSSSGFFSTPASFHSTSAASSDNLIKLASQASVPSLSSFLLMKTKASPCTCVTVATLGKLQCVWNTLKFPETDFFSISVFRYTLKKPILAGFSMFQLYALFLMQGIEYYYLSLHGCCNSLYSLYQTLSHWTWNHMSTCYLRTTYIL